MTTFGKIVFFFVILVAVGALWAYGAVHQIWLASSDEGTVPVSFVIEEGQGAKVIGAHLKDQKLIQNTFWFEMYVWMKGLEDDFRAGEFELQPGSNVASIVSILTTNIVGKDVEIMIPEGYTLAEIGAVLERELGISQNDWQSAVGADSLFEGEAEILKDKPDDVDLEGYLFPDTYRFHPDVTGEDVARKMLATMALRLNENAQEIGEIENLHELLTLASIIEREVRTDEDRPIVADIFLKRLDIGMALQADSTVNYITGGNDPSISYEDTELDSPYNTYKYPGLPPGPISNPGLASILAAANPELNSYYYFLTDKEGNVYYAETLEGHNQNRVEHL